MEPDGAPGGAPRSGLNTSVPAHRARDGATLGTAKLSSAFSFAVGTAGCVRLAP
jgi:hypothetical protein